MKKPVFAINLLLSLFAMNAVWVEERSFEFGELNVRMSFDEIRKKYPNSNYLTPPKSYSSSLIWVSPEDVKNGVYFIEFSRKKAVSQIRLSFERPDNQVETPGKSWEESHYLNHPLCQEILGELTEKYGKPIVQQKSVEEALEWQPYKWVRKSETLVLKCYSLNGKGQVLAADIVMTSE